MIQPEPLKKDEPLQWSSGSGRDVWDLFQACIRGDLAAVKRLVGKHARDEDTCSTPLGRAAKFGQAKMVDFLLARGA